MAFNGAVFSPAYNSFSDTLNTAVVGNYTGFIDLISGPLKTGMIIYIILLGAAIMRGAVQYPFREYVYRSFQLAALYWALTSLYGAIIAGMIVDGLPNEFASILGANIGGIGDTFDSFVARGMTLILDMYIYVDESLREAGITELAGKLGYALIAFLFIAVCVAAIFAAAATGFVFVVYTLFALACLAVVGPLFVAALLFQSTRGFFFSWLGAVVNYVMLALFSVLLVVVMTHVTESATAGLVVNGANIIPTAILIMGVYILAGFFFLQIPSLASSIGGGSPALAAQFASATGAIAGRTISAGAQAGRQGYQALRRRMAP